MKPNLPKSLKLFQPQQHHQIPKSFQTSKLFDTDWLEDSGKNVLTWNWAMKKGPPWLFRVYSGLYYPGIWGIIIKHYKDPYETTRIQWKQMSISGRIHSWKFACWTSKLPKHESWKVISSSIIIFGPQKPWKNKGLRSQNIFVIRTPRNGSCGFAMGDYNGKISGRFFQDLPGSRDPATSAEVSAYEGDIVIMGSDGVFDNLCPCF